MSLQLASSDDLAVRPVPREPPCRCRWLMPVCLLWVIGVVYCWWSVTAYGFKRESTGIDRAVENWPQESRIPAGRDRSTLLFFLHPKCPCTVASLAEMERLLPVSSATSHRNPGVIFVATVPDGHSQDWLSSRTIQSIERLSGATLFVDVGGVEANRFGAATSGTVMWFDELGRRLYSGGITLARGHEGGNLGRDRLGELLAGCKKSVSGVPALGCKLCLPND